MTATTESANAMIVAHDWLRSRPLGHVIDGDVVQPDEGDRLPVLDPTSGEAIAEIPAGSAADVDRAVSAARVAQGGWRATTPVDRAKVLIAVADAVDSHADELALIESLNTGKPLSVSRAEIPLVADAFRFMAGAMRAMHSPATDEYVSGYVSMIRREPVGVVGAITPWNYPLLTASWKIAAALAMGNGMVLKPSELTPLTTLRFMEIVSDILPPGVLNVVLGTAPVVGAAISQHSGIDLVSLTGSVASGQLVMADASRTLKPTHLELGGKAPVLVFDDADLDLVAESVRVAGFWNTGQECGAATRIICAAPIREELTRRLVEQAGSLKVGTPEDGEDIEIGPLMSEAHRERVSGMVSRARESGASVALGGVAPEGSGFFYPPTILADVERGSEIATEEVFGPVISIETFTTEEDGIDLANDVAYGLSASVWTENVGRALRVSSALDFGTVWVNSHLVLATEMPWGGFAASGHGRELSTLSLEDFSRTKHVMVATGSA